MFSRFVMILVLAFAVTSCASLSKMAPKGLLQNGTAKKLTLADVNAEYAKQKDSPFDVFKAQEVAYTTFEIKEVDDFVFTVAKIQGTVMLIKKMKDLATSGDVKALNVDSFKDGEALAKGSIELAKATLEQATNLIPAGQALVTSVPTIAASKPTALPAITSEVKTALDRLLAVVEELKNLAM
jgi:hypothetical protein